MNSSNQFNHIINAVTTLQRKWRQKQEYSQCAICEQSFWIQHLSEVNGHGHFCADCYWYKGPGNRSYWRGQTKV